MQIIKLMLATPMLLSLSLSAQSLKEIRKNMQPIPAATFNMGGGYQYETEGASMLYLGQDQKFEGEAKGKVKIGEIPAPNNPNHMVNLEPFLISSQEVTNQQYRDFLRHSVLSQEERTQFDADLLDATENFGLQLELWEGLAEKASQVNLMPDVHAWDTDFIFAYNEPLVINYLWHPAFNKYPVVGVTWQQARDYCDWLTDFNNADRKAHGLEPSYAFRLPSEAEWEFAARGKRDCDYNLQAHRDSYPWKGTSIRNQKGKFQANIRTGHTSYIDDGHEYTMPVDGFATNGFGLYNMAGNAAEWTDDAFEFALYPEEKVLPVLPPSEKDDDQHRVVKGGSWADYHYAAQTGSRCKALATKGSSRIGFRIAQSTE